MDQRLKERLVGATVLVVLAVVFIPMLLDDTQEDKDEITGTIIPPKPDGEFSSRIIPLEKDIEDVTTEVPPENVAIETPVVKTVPEMGPDQPALQDIKEKQKPALATSDVEPPGHNVGINAWVVQLGSFSSEVNAQSLNKKLRDGGYPAFVEPVKEKNSIAYRVRVGPELKRSDAQTIRDKIKKTMDLDGIVISYP